MSESFRFSGAGERAEVVAMSLKIQRLEGRNLVIRSVRLVVQVRSMLSNVMVYVLNEWVSRLNDSQGYRCWLDSKVGRI
jgi:hypothetical protein